MFAHRVVVVVAVGFDVGQRRGGEDGAWAGDEELGNHGARRQDTAGGREEDDVDKACVHVRYEQIYPERPRSNVPLRR